MARFTSIQNSFASGALSDLMRARTDLAIYNNSASIIENFEITPEGAATKRKGISEAGYFDEDSSWDVGGADYKRTCYPIEFTTTDGQKFIILFLRYAASTYQSYIRIFKLIDGMLEETKNFLDKAIFEGFPTDHMQIGDIVFVTFDNTFPQCLFLQDGEVKSIPYSNFNNRANSYLGSPVDQQRSDLSVYLHYATGSFNTLKAGNSSDPATMFPYPLFEVHPSSPSKLIQGHIAFHMQSSATDYVNKTAWVRFDNVGGSSLLGYSETGYVEPTAKASIFLSRGDLKGHKISYRAFGADGSNHITGIAYLGTPIGPSPIDNDYQYLLYRNWIEAASPIGGTPITFPLQVACLITIKAVHTINAYCEGPITLANLDKTNVFSEGFFGSKYGYPSCVGMVSGRLSFSGVKGAAGRIFLSSHKNLFRLNVAKLRQDDPAYYKVNTKATDVSGLNYFGDKVGPDPEYGFANSSSIENVLWIESVGEVTIIGTDRGEMALTAETLDKEVRINVYSVSSYGSNANKAITVANSVYFVDSYGQLIGITKESNGVKASNISSMNTTIVPEKINSIVYNRKKQQLLILPYDSNEVVGFTTSNLTGVSGFFKSIYSLENTGPNIDSLVGMLIVDDKVLLIRFRNEIGKALSFALESSSYIDLADNKFKARLVTLPLDYGNPYGSSQGIMSRLHSIIIKLYKAGHCVFGSNEGDLEVAPIEVGTEFSGQLKLNFPASSDIQSVVQIESEENAPLTVLGLVYQGEGHE